jgi:excisionase family DNA binding protein
MSVYNRLSVYPPQLWHTDEAAEYFQVHMKTIQGWCRKKKLPAKKVGRCWYVIGDRVHEMFGECPSDN